MKKVITLFLVFNFQFATSQTKELTFEKLKMNMVDFLYSIKEIRTEEELAQYKSGERIIDLDGVVNFQSSGKLKNGMYRFSISSSHHLVFFVLVENEKYTILDISTLQGLSTSLTELMEFSEKNKLCVDFTIEYSTHLIATYNKINKNRGQRGDINCVKGISNKGDLP